MNENQVRSLSVFFPCYNESANVANVTKKTLETLEGLGIDFEVIIVNDGSSDDTAAVAEKIASENERVRVIHHEKNSGYGAALQSGFRAASKDFIFYTDGDGQFDISEMPALLPLISDCDIVSCYRINRQDSLVRKINAFCWTTLVCFLFRMNIRDIDCAFKLFRREIFDNIEMHSTGALIDTEILARAKKKGYRVVQKGVHHYPRTAGTQTGAKISVVLRAFKELFELYKEIKKSNR
ncbi:MAG: glycosyltransferase [Planctomycetes bacterium]|nr:glycosyltransferase [Planctomycetota bacterium]